VSASASASENVPSVLHGAWYVNDLATANPISTSDRRLKSSIRSLTDGVLSRTNGESQQPDWFLRQLRPVSFKFRVGALGALEEDPRERYGFIADEVEQVLPEMVQSIKRPGDTEEVQAVAYQDFIALLVAAQQKHDAAVRGLDERLAELLSYVKAIDSRLAKLEGSKL